MPVEDKYDSKGLIRTNRQRKAKLSDSSKLSRYERFVQASHADKNTLAMETGICERI